MGEYDKALALAQRLIAKKGRAVSLQRLTSTPTDASMPWKGQGSPVVEQTLAVQAVFLPHTGTIDLGKYLEITEDLLKRCEQVALIAGSTVDLTTFHQFLDAGSTWKIEWMRELKPGDLTVLYVFGVKR